MGTSPVPLTTEHCLCLPRGQGHQLNPENPPALSGRQGFMAEELQFMAPWRNMLDALGNSKWKVSLLNSKLSLQCIFIEEG